MLKAVNDATIAFFQGTSKYIVAPLTTCCMRAKLFGVEFVVYINFTIEQQAASRVP